MPYAISGGTSIISATETPQSAARRFASQALAEGYKPEALHEYRNADRETHLLAHPCQARERREVDTTDDVAQRSWLRTARAGFSPTGKKPLLPASNRYAAHTAAPIGSSRAKNLRTR